MILDFDAKADEAAYIIHITKNQERGEKRKHCFQSAVVTNFEDFVMPADQLEKYKYTLVETSS